jgi:hypothetical protein
MSIIYGRHLTPFSNYEKNFYDEYDNKDIFLYEINNIAAYLCLINNPPNFFNSLSLLNLGR